MTRPRHRAALLAALALAAPLSLRLDPAAALTPGLTAVGRLAYTGGTDLEFTRINGRRYVVAGAQNNYNPKVAQAGLRVIDVTNPAKPVVAGFLPCNTSQNDIQVRGRYAFLAIDFNARADAEGRPDCFEPLEVAPKGGVVIVDLANPRKPKPLSFVPVPGAAHNTTVHPRKPILYVSESESANPNLDEPGTAPVHIVDWSNPRRPKLLPDVDIAPVDSAHDITFNAKGDRAYVAAGFGGFVAILDTTDPAKPKVISRFADPAINFSHQADPTPDGKYLLVSDELAGAEGLLHCPGGGVHVWDISNPSAPAKVGAYFIPDAFASTEPGPRPIVGQVKPFRCTAHVMRIAPDGKTLVMAWYSQGIQVLDLSGLPGISVGAQGQDRGTGIKRLAAWTTKGADAWSAKMDDRGYVFTGDTQRGMDVVRFVRPKAPVTPAGEWLTPAEALARSVRDRIFQPSRGYFCFERLTRLGK